MDTKGRQHKVAEFSKKSGEREDNRKGKVSNKRLKVLIEEY